MDEYTEVEHAQKAIEILLDECEAKRKETKRQEDLNLVECPSVRLQNGHHYGGNAQGSNRGGVQPPCDPSKLLCYQCREPWHFVKYCPKAKSMEGNPGEMKLDNTPQGPKEMKDLDMD